MSAETRSTERVRAHRKRRKRGLVRLPVDMSKAELDQLEAHGYVDAKSRGDRYSAAGGVERAVRDFLLYLSVTR